MDFLRLFRILRLSALLGCLAFVGSPTMADAAVPRVQRMAMVDLQRILDETKAGQRARAELESSFKAKQARLDKQRAQLEGKAAKLSNLEGKALAQAQQKLQAESMAWQEKAQKLEQTLAQQENQLLEDIYNNSQRIVKKIAEEKNLDLILVRDQMTVIYTQGSLDITDEVIKRYNKIHPK